MFFCMTFLLSAVAFFVLLTGLILIHECGHFFAAKSTKVDIEEFGFGLPPRALKLFRWQGTLFSLNWIPFGGFVRLKGEGEMDEKRRMALGSFCRASICARFLILVAGVGMNFILALVIFTIGFSVGHWVPTYTSLTGMEEAAKEGKISMELSVLIDDVISGGSAARAGLMPGAWLVSVDGHPVLHPEDVVRAQEGRKSVTYIIQDSEKSVEKKFSLPLIDGKTGVVLRSVPRNVSAPNHDIGDSLILALRESGVVTAQTVMGIARLFGSLVHTGAVPEGITGIVGIAKLTHSSVQEGFMVYLRLVALLSLSLAVLNILPFPALDGGRLFFVFYEVIRRRPPNRRWEMVTNTVGLSFLLLLILWVTFYDVLRLFI